MLKWSPKPSEIIYLGKLDKYQLLKANHVKKKEILLYFYRTLKSHHCLYVFLFSIGDQFVMFQVDYKRIKNEGKLLLMAS